jgi:hypothetical protein
VKQNDQKGEFDEEQSPVFLFYAMEAAKLAGDFERAAAAKRRLEALGVRVDYQPQGQGKKPRGTRRDQPE